MATNTAVHSAAFNFQSFVRSGVDQRTGLYTMALSLPEVRTCDLSGPAIPLTLSFNLLNPDNAGFGKGWELMQTQYAPFNKILSLHSGQTFKVTGAYPGVPNRLYMKEQKIEDVQFFELPDNTFKVVHKSGQVEILELKGAIPKKAVPVKIYSAQGHEVTLEYDTAYGLPVLSVIRDSTGVVLRITRDTVANTVTFAMSFTTGVPTAQVILNLKNDRIDRVTLPTTEGAGYRIEYETHKTFACISKLLSPSGAVEKISYNDEGHDIPGDARKLPRVTEHVTELGSDQSSITVKYTYGTDGRNFLGARSGINYQHDGLDTLFRLNERYEYTTTESLMVGTETVRSVTRTFNRFHLETVEDTLQGNRRKTVRTHYYADDNDQLSFDAQPRQCQLPRKTSTLLSISDDPRYFRNDVERNEFDIHGNQTLKVEPSGMSERTEYYPAEETPGLCPKDPYGFVRHVREKTCYPASDPALIPDIQPGAHTLRSRFRYVARSPLSGSPITETWVSLAQEQLFELVASPARSRARSRPATAEPVERQLSSTVFDYIHAPGDPLTHGRRLRQAKTMGSDGGPTTVIDYSYTKNPANHTVRTLQRSSNNFDQCTRTVIDERSVLHGEPVLVTENDIQRRFQYDALLRVTRDIQAPDTEYPASCIFRYRLIRPVDAGQTPPALQAYQEMVDVKGVTTRTHFDALSRVVREELQDKDHSGGGWRDIYTARYNEKGLLVEETQIDWLKTTDLPLTTRYTYDLWGLCDSVTRPDGVTMRTLNDLHRFTTEEWIEGSARTRTITNRFEKTVRVEKIGLDGRRISQQSFKYDGLGNCTQKVDELGQITHYRYDAFSRLCRTTLPDLSTVDNSYAEHSTAELCTSIDLTPGNTQLECIRAGTQVFDGLDRLTQVTIGSRTDKLEYEAGYLQPAKRITPAGKPIHYDYMRGLTAKPTKITAPDDVSTFDVDLEDAQLDKSTNSQGNYAFAYDKSGQLTAETWTDAVDRKSYTTRYSTSLKGRPLSRTDIRNHDTISTYDLSNGRLLSIGQLQLQATFEYDAIGRMFRTVSTDKGSGNTLTTTLEFDVLGRETRRTLVLLDSLKQPVEAGRSIELTYLADNNVHTRHLRVAGTTALLETYRYDPRGRVEHYRCSGSELPRDRFGNEIISQYFEYDAIDNIPYSRTVFSDGSVNVAHFSFSKVDPCQLAGMRHSHPDYQGLQTAFRHDADGNLEQDELGNQLSYDTQGRLHSVATSAGQPLMAYRYNAHDHLQSVKAEGNSQTLRFYQGTRIADTLEDDRHIKLLYHQQTPLGQQTPGDDGQTLLLLTDAKQSVFAEQQGSELHSTAYGPYGERDSDTSMTSLPAYNGEAVEQFGWYLLGNGYRAYNPGLMRFHNPDFMAVFGPGGLNPYVYCGGNPIAFSDPTGHQRRGRIIDNTAFNVGMGVGTTILGIAISFLTFNPAPLIATLAVVGVKTTAATIATVTSAVSWGTMGMAIGNEVARTFVKDPKIQEGLGWTSLILDAIALPTPKLPDIPIELGKLPKGRHSVAISTRSRAAPINDAQRLTTTRTRARPRAFPGENAEVWTPPPQLSMAASSTVPTPSPSQAVPGAMRAPMPVPEPTQMVQPQFAELTGSSSSRTIDELVNSDTARQQENVVLDGQQWNHFRQGWHKPDALGN